MYFLIWPLIASTNASLTSEGNLCDWWRFPTFIFAEDNRPQKGSRVDSTLEVCMLVYRLSCSHCSLTFLFRSSSLIASFCRSAVATFCFAWMSYHMALTDNAKKANIWIRQVAHLTLAQSCEYSHSCWLVVVCVTYWGNLLACISSLIWASQWLCLVHMFTSELLISHKVRVLKHTHYNLPSAVGNKSTQKSLVN